MKKSILLFAALMILFLAACSSGAEAVEFTIHMDEFGYSPDTLEFKVGQTVTLHLVNDGTLEHEIMFGRDVMMSDGMANAFMVDMFEWAGVEPEGMMTMMTMAEGTGDEMEMGDHTHNGYMTTVDAENPTATITFTVTEEMLGEWVFGCFLQEGTHYAAGMHGTLVVTE